MVRHLQDVHRPDPGERRLARVLDIAGEQDGAIAELEPHHEGDLIGILGVLDQEVRRGVQDLPAWQRRVLRTEDRQPTLGADVPQRLVAVLSLQRGP